MLFVLGRIYDPESLDHEPAIVTVYADGKKIADEVVRKYDVPKRMKLDIAGADRLEFRIVKGEDDIGFAEVSLWKEGETPVETGNPLPESPEPVELVRDLKPYAQYNHFCVSPDMEYKTVRVNGKEHHYGIVCNMNMAFIGVQPGASYFNLRGQYETLSLLSGPTDNAKSSGGKGWLTIKADGKIIHEYEVSQTDIARRIVLDVSGCRQLSFHTEQSEQSMYAAIVDARLYPEGEYRPEDSEQETDIDPKLADLPDVCKLVSNIPPYAVGGQIEHQVYSGESDYITFSMGGTRFNEGFILYEKADFWNDNIVSYAVFDLGNQFDYVSFTAGYVGKSWTMTMTNDVIRVYADDRLILEAPMMATYPNQDFILPIGKCRKLRFENGGSGNLNVGAYGIADIVVYRGEPVENELFVHPVPECPYETDLIDLGAPYIHYVSTKADARDQIFYDGSTQRRYFEMPDGSRINKGFMLQTSVHFSLDHGVLSGTDNAAAGAIGGAAVGSAFVAAGAAVGGAVVGSTLIGAAAFLMLAAGGNAIENSCAAFNTYGRYNSVTFTVACLRPFSGSQSVDSYISDCTEAYSETLKLLEDTKPMYKIYTTYLETASGEACKAVSIRIDDEERLNDGDYLDISQEYQACLEELQRLRKLDADLAGLGLSYVNAGLGLPELGLGAIAYGRVLKTGRQTVKACIEAVKEMTAEKQAELSEQFRRGTLDLLQSFRVAVRHDISLVCVGRRVAVWYGVTPSGSRRDPRLRSLSNGRPCRCKAMHRHGLPTEWFDIGDITMRRLWLRAVWSDGTLIPTDRLVIQVMSRRRSR